MGPGKRATAVESRRIAAAKAGVCVVCLTRMIAKTLPPQWVVVGHEGTGSLFFGLLEYHHLKSGNVRRGHMAGLGVCPYHHRGVPQNDMTLAQCRDRWGTALTDGSRLFHETYGSDDELLSQQDEILRLYHPGEPELCAPT